MKNLLKGLEVNAKDNLLTALSKGMAVGGLRSGVTVLGLAGGLFVIGKTLQVSKQIDEIQMDEEVKTEEV